MHAQAVNRISGIALMDDGTSLPVAQWIGADGEYSGPVDAVVAIAGPTKEGHWIVIDLRKYVPTRVN